VTRLRKAGQLDEARQLATFLLEQSPQNLYNRRAAAWVYLDFLKRESQDISESLFFVEKYLQLQFDASEKIMWEQLYWLLAKSLFRLSAPPEAPLIDRLWDCWHKLARIEGRGYSTLLKSVLKHASSWPNLSKWVACWGWGHLQPVDFEPETLPNGKRIPALAERAYIAVSKAYLTQPDELLKDTFLNQLDAVSEQYPDMLYLVYYRALLRLKTGQRTEALAFFIPFAQKKKRDFWVWDLLSELHPDNNNMQMACLAKALTCKTSPEFLVKIRQKMAALFVAEGRWNEARAEIEQLCRVREANQWRIPREIENWKRVAAYHNATSTITNYGQYTQIARLAEQLLTPAQKEMIGVIWAINEEKQTAQFVVDEQIFGGFNYGKAGMTSIAVGDALSLRLHQIKQAESTFWKVEEAKKTKNQPPENLVKPFVGPLRMNGRVGFVGQVMVALNQIKFAFDIVNAPEVTGMAVRAYDPKHKKWGWKAIYVQKNG
jgi:hypothetical protein